MKPRPVDQQEVGMIQDPFVTQLAGQLAGFVEGYRDDLPETLWVASLAMIDKATARTRDWHWWRSYPDAELRRLRERLASALALARLAASLQEADNDVDRDLDRELREAATDAAAARRRAQTMPAERARLENARRRREGR